MVGALLVAGISVVAAYGLTAAPPSSLGNGRGMMGGAGFQTSPSAGFGGMGGMMGGGMMGGGMMGQGIAAGGSVNATSGWDMGDMLTWCRNAMAGLFNQTTLP
jgi:hypothetical protein